MHSGTESRSFTAAHLRDLLDELGDHVLRVELGAEAEHERRRACARVRRVVRVRVRLAGGARHGGHDALRDGRRRELVRSHLLVELQPVLLVLRVVVLEAEEPDFAEAERLRDLHAIAIEAMHY